MGGSWRAMIGELPFRTYALTLKSLGLLDEIENIGEIPRIGPEITEMAPFRPLPRPRISRNPRGMYAQFLQIYDNQRDHETEEKP